MWLVAKEKSGWSIEIIPEGVYIARCVGLTDLGTQVREFSGKKKEVHEIRIDFELPTLTYTYEDQESKEEVTATKMTGAVFTNSLSSKANLRKFLEGWRGRKFTKEELEGFDLTKLLGLACQLQILHSDDGKWANVSSAMSIPQGMAVPEATRELTIFSMDEDKIWEEGFYDEEVFDNLPEFLQKIIRDSIEMRKHFWNETLEEQEENMKQEAADRKAQEAEDKQITAETTAPVDEKKQEADAAAAEGIFSKKEEDDPFGEKA